MKRRPQATREGRAAVPLMIRGHRPSTARTLRAIRARHSWTSGVALDRLVALYVETERHATSGKAQPFPRDLMTTAGWPVGPLR